MPFVTLNDVRHFYRLEGSSGLPVLVLSHSIGTDQGMWEPQIPDLLRYFQVLRYDTRGHGASDAPASNYSIEQLGCDAVALMDHLDIARAAFCGLSMGGAIGQWLGIHTPDRITHLVLANTSPRFGNPGNWEERIETVKGGGMKAIVHVALHRFFSNNILNSSNPHVGSIRSVLLGTDPAGYIGCCAALRDFDSRGQIAKITSPSLIIAGDFDVSTPWAGNSDVLAHDIAGAKSVRLAAAHLSNLEKPRSFTAAILEFLQAVDPYTVLEKGFEVRRAVLGSTHVDHAIANSTDFNRDFQELITRYAWGTVWSRPLLDHRTRRLIALAIMAALGRWEEFRMHLRAGLDHELELCDLKELLLLLSIYAGVPAANTGFTIAKELSDERINA
jgi:3-oxoadipate enol-lactonase/4-carboxymuconolactone decarboxylase